MHAYDIIWLLKLAMMVIAYYTVRGIYRWITKPTSRWIK